MENIYFMKNYNKITIRIIIFLTSILLFPSCEKEDDSILDGTWTNLMQAQPNGYYINELKFFKDSAFISKTSAFGIYVGQGTDDLTAWFEHSGNYSQSIDKLYFISHKFVYLDTFWGDQPQTQIKDELLFDNCSFKVSDKVLELKYTTYPFDAPEETVRLYTKVK
jgi:hypothetical protein